MRKYFIGLFMALAILSFPLKAFAAEANVTLMVDGLSCPFCAYGLEKKIKKLDKELALTISSGRLTRGVSGLGDTTFIARYTVWKRDRQGETVRIAPFAMIKAPTGDDDESDSLGRLPRKLQLGSGSWDYTLGVVTSWQTFKWELDSSVSYRFNTKADSFSFGDEAKVDISCQHRLLPRKLGSGMPYFFNGVIESSLVWKDKNETKGSSFTFVKSFGVKGSAPGEFNEPYGIAADTKGKIYVVELYNHRVQKFDNEGRFLTSWGSEKKVSNVKSVLFPIFSSESPGRFYYPAKIDIGPYNRVYVSDSYNNRVQVFTEDGEYLSQWGGMGFWAGRFRVASGIAVNREGHAYVADFYNNRVQVFDSDGLFLTSFGSKGSGEGEFQGPTGVAVNGKGDLYVVDWGGHRVQHFAPLHPSR